MKKVFILLVVVIIVVGSASGWEFGLKGGFSFSEVKFDPDVDESLPDAEDKMYIGYVLGAWAVYPLNEQMGILCELKLANYGDRFDIPDSDPEVKFYYEFCMIEMPVLFYYMPMEKMKVYAGPMVGYLTKAKQSIFNEIAGQDFDFLQTYLMTDSMKRMNFSFVLGVQYWLLPDMFADIRYNMGLTDLNDGMLPIWFPEGAEIKTSSIELSVGYQF